LDDFKTGKLSKEIRRYPRVFVYSARYNKFFLVSNEELVVENEPDELCRFIGSSHFISQDEKKKGIKCGGRVYSRDELSSPLPRMQLKEFLAEIDKKLNPFEDARKRCVDSTFEADCNSNSDCSWSNGKCEWNAPDEVSPLKIMSKKKEQCQEMLTNFYNPGISHTKRVQLLEEIEKLKMAF
jgi:hypothetical protein